MSLHLLVRSAFTLLFVAVFGLSGRAAKQVSNGDPVHYGQLARIIADRNPIRFVLAGGLLALAVLAIYLTFITD